MKKIVKIIRNFFATIKTRKGIISLISVALVLWYIFCLPSSLFNNPVSTVLEDSNGRLLSARIADDGQWRFPQTNKIPAKFVACLVQFEDKNFFNHFGVDILAFVRAIKQNIAAGKIKSGGSTISMQVLRLSRKGQKRTFYEKIIELILATRMELSFNKFEILSMYSANAPFGSNIVGLEAASWRYFGREPQKLSWAESATLAVLPNAPSLIYPGKNQKRLLEKRNRLLDKLYNAKIIDKETCDLSKSEPLPQKAFSIPQLSPHLLQRAIKEGNKGKRIRSTVSADLQEKVSGVVNNFHKIFKTNEIHNACAIVIDVNTGNVLAYVGNTTEDKNEHENNVDIIDAPRSTGSILKPFLYANMLNEGMILPSTLVPDIPTHIAGFSPQNFDLSYDGAVPAKRALARSLNIPAVKMLQDYGVEKFYHNLQKLGMTTLYQNPDHYGLSLILGGAEGKLWDLSGMYASMARILNNYTSYNGKYNLQDLHQPFYVKTHTETQIAENSILDASSIYLAFDAMHEVSRPDEDASWKLFSSSKKIAWKTGTSFGFRDGWAVGVTPEYVVGVWVGNADGEGRPGLTGIQTAAPLMFSVFNSLKNTTWFQQPFDNMEKMNVCGLSGSKATEICAPVYTRWVQKNGLRTGFCKYHKIIHLDNSSTYRVNSNCEDVSNMKHVSWFVLPPSIEGYYKLKNSNYKTLPPYRKGCEPDNTVSMEIIYPKNFSKIYVPVDIDGNLSKTVFEVAHRNSNAIIHWHMDGTYIGSTQNMHQMGLNPAYGNHTLVLVDEDGESITQQFEIINKK